VSALQPRWVEDCRAAITLLGEAGSLPTPQVVDLADAATRKVVGVRDALIDRLREESSGSERDKHRAALDQINIAVSELASVEYPGALERSHLDTVQSVLRKLIGESVPEQKPEPEPLRPTAPPIHAEAQPEMPRRPDLKPAAPEPDGPPLPAPGILGVTGGVAEQEIHGIEIAPEQARTTPPG